MSPDKIPINWFDLALVVVLVLGIWRGRKHGMSQELMPLLKWLLVVLGASLAYQQVGLFFAQNTPFGRLFCFVMGYLTVILLVFAFFSLFTRALGGKLVGSDLFGRAEYYLGMGAGMLRVACILLVALALHNARLYSTAEVRAMQKFQKDNFDANFFPTLQTLQDEVFVRSLTGSQIKKYCSQLLITPTPPGGGEMKRAKKDLPGV
jgi:uncharacterized membrane protein required for colicin V production